MVYQSHRIENGAVMLAVGVHIVAGHIVPKPEG
jgi:hypothetical protein